MLIKISVLVVPTHAAMNLYYVIVYISVPIPVSRACAVVAEYDKYLQDLREVNQVCVCAVPSVMAAAEHVSLSRTSPCSLFGSVGGS